MACVLLHKHFDLYLAIFEKSFNIFSYHFGARGRGRQLALSITVHEQAKSNRACNIFNIVVLGFLQGFFWHQKQNHQSHIWVTLILYVKTVSNQ
jgi:hypothetical protein